MLLSYFTRGRPLEGGCLLLLSYHDVVVAPFASSQLPRSTPACLAGVGCYPLTFLRFCQSFLGRGCLALA